MQNAAGQIKHGIRVLQLKGKKSPFAPMADELQRYIPSRLSTRNGSGDLQKRQGSAETPWQSAPSRQVSPARIVHAPMTPCVRPSRVMLFSQAFIKSYAADPDSPCVQGGKVSSMQGNALHTAAASGLLCAAPIPVLTECSLCLLEA